VLENNEFGVKHRILRQEPTRKFLLYHAGPPPADLDNWLLDVQLAHAVFRADQTALWLSELGLGQEFAEVVAPHAEFFHSARRRETLKALSGLMKILYPHREATVAEIEELLKFAIEGRRRVKDQLMRIDPTYAEVHFGYQRRDGSEQTVKTLEEELYPRQYGGSASAEEMEPADAVVQPERLATGSSPALANGPQPGHLTFQEYQRGVTYEQLFGPYLRGAQHIVVTDPYIRLFYQARNFMEFLETVARQKADDEEIAVHLVTTEDEFKGDQQRGFFEQMQIAAAAVGIRLTWEFDATNTIHARHIVTDHGWKILLDRGLDIYQHYEMNDAFAFANRLQQYRACKAFEVTYLKVE
jgi:ATP-dependent Lon protease